MHNRLRTAGISGGGDQQVLVRQQQVAEGFARDYGLAGAAQGATFYVNALAACRVRALITVDKTSKATAG